MKDRIVTAAAIVLAICVITWYITQKPKIERRTIEGHTYYLYSKGGMVHSEKCMNEQHQYLKIK